MIKCAKPATSAVFESWSQSRQHTLVGL